MKKYVGNIPRPSPLRDSKTSGLWPLYRLWDYKISELLLCIESAGLGKISRPSSIESLFASCVCSRTWKNSNLFPVCRQALGLGKISGCPLYIGSRAQKNSVFWPIYKLWDLEKFRASAHLYRLWDLKISELFLYAESVRFKKIPRSSHREPVGKAPSEARCVCHMCCGSWRNSQLLLY